MSAIMVGMIEIGHKQLRAVRTVITEPNGKRRLVPKLEDGQPVTRLVANEPVRVTRNKLGGHFCRYKSRRLVVKFMDGDLLELRPKGTRQAVRAPLIDIYGWILRSTAMKERMTKLREIKAAKEQRRAERRLTRQLRA